MRAVHERRELQAPSQAVALNCSQSRDVQLLKPVKSLVKAVKRLGRFGLVVHAVQHLQVCAPCESFPACLR